MLLPKTSLPANTKNIENRTKSQQKKVLQKFAYVAAVLYFCIVNLDSTRSFTCFAHRFFVGWLRSCRSEAKPKKQPQKHENEVIEPFHSSVVSDICRMRG